MSAFPSLPLFTDAYLADTRHLTAQEHGAYLLLLMMAWRMPDCRLPNDDAKLAKWACVDARTWKRIKPTVMAFWTLAEDHWSQSRLSREREFVSKRADVARENGKQGGRPKPQNYNGSDNPAGSLRVTQQKAPSPKPLVKEPIAQQPNAASAALPSDWLERSLDANGIAGFREERSIGLMNPAAIVGLLEAGFDFERDWLASIRAKPNPQAKTWGYFVPQTRDFAATKARVASVPKPLPQGEDWNLRLEVFRKNGTWIPAWGERPGEPGCRVPAELLTRAA